MSVTVYNAALLVASTNIGNTITDSMFASRSTNLTPSEQMDAVKSEISAAFVDLASIIASRTIALVGTQIILGTVTSPTGAIASTFATSLLGVSKSYKSNVESSAQDNAELIVDSMFDERDTDLDTDAQIELLRTEFVQYMTAFAVDIVNETTTLLDGQTLTPPSFTANTEIGQLAALTVLSTAASTAASNIIDAQFGKRSTNVTPEAQIKLVKSEIVAEFNTFVAAIGTSIATMMLSTIFTPNGGVGITAVQTLPP